MAFLNGWQWLSENHLWVIEIFTVILLTLTASLAARYLIALLLKQAAKSTNFWDDALLVAAKRPLQISIWAYGLFFTVHVIEQKSVSIIFEFLKPLEDLGLAFLIGWFLVKFVKEAENNLVRVGGQSEKYDPTTIHAIGKLLRASVIITMFLIGLQSLGFSVSGILAFGGIGGLAIGLAAKDLLANFFGGLMLYFDRPFVIGDWIRSPDRSIEGTVEYIGWRLTRIRTFDKRPLYVPNAAFANITVENPSRMQNRRIYETIGIRYDDIHKMDAIVKAVKTMLETHPEIDASKTLIVNFNAFAASSVDFFVYVFTKTTEWVHYHQVKHEVLLKIAAIIAAHQAQIAYPTSTLHLQHMHPENEKNAVKVEREFV